MTDGDDAVDGRALALYGDYQDRLRALNAADFGDLLLHCLIVFQDQPEILKKYQDQFRYLLVDEYQDTNVAQYLWLRLLAQAHKNICCVGDDDQSIYGWRGAEVGNILRFEKDFPGARVIRLERNYRSTPQILAAASGLIAKNQGRLGKTLWTDGESGEKLVLRGVWDGEEEALAVGDEIEVQVLDIDRGRERISLSLKATQQDPWQEFAEGHQVGELATAGSPSWSRWLVRPGRRRHRGPGPHLGDVGPPRRAPRAGGHPG